MAPLFRLVSFLSVLFTWVCLATGASVHRRGRCIGVLLSLGYGLSLVFVLVCLSIDVTGALVLPNSFCFARFFLLHAPPFFCPLVISPYSGPAQFASLLLCLCCPPSPCLSCASLRVLPGGARVIVLSLSPRARRLFWFLCSSLCLCGPRCSRVACPPLLCFLSLSFLPPLPREWSLLCSGPAYTPVCWCLPRSIWLQL